MPHDVTMPQLGMAQDAGKIVSWLKASGDAVSKGDALFEVETDKAVMEVEAPRDGFLVGITAAEGDEVPVGKIIAQIADSPEEAPKDAGGEKTEVPPPKTDDLPEGRPVTMPQLGMAQDSGLIVSWLKAPGEAVAADDLLFEVETDKSTMEVPAGIDGFLAATLAEPGEDVPVGQAVALISAGKPANPVARKSGAAPEAPVAKAPPEPAQTPAAPKPSAAPAARPTPASGGRILASPKARRLALERGLDLARLVEAGHPQPYHVADFDVLAALPDSEPRATAAPTASASALHLAARVPRDGFTDFADWAAKAHGLTDADALLAGLGGACLPGTGPVRVDVSRMGRTRRYTVPRRALSDVTADADGAPDLILRDLRSTALSHVHLGADGAPVITLLAAETGIALSLEAAAGNLAPEEAILLLTGFSGRMEQPLRHLL